MSKRRSFSLVGVGVISALAIGLSGAPAAYAGNQDDPAACESNVTSQFKFTLWYNSSYSGALRNIGYNVWDFNDERIGGSSQGGDPQPMYWCNNGAGAGLRVKNNAASAQNRHASYNATVYYRSGYWGISDTLSPFSSWFQLKNTYNNNASFQWT